MFQMIYLRFTQPRADKNAFDVLSDQYKTQLANQSVVPEFGFYEALAAARYHEPSATQIPTPEMVDKWNLEKSLAFYKDRFADASDFTFVFVGSFDLPTIKPLVERYLGSLPSIKRKETWKDIGVHTPNDVVVKRVEKRRRAEKPVAIVFSGPFEYNQTNRVAIRAMSEILQRRLLETIREEFSGTYGIRASQSYSRNSQSGVLGHDRLRLRSETYRRSHQARLRRDREAQDEWTDRQAVE